MAVCVFTSLAMPRLAIAGGAGAPAKPPLLLMFHPGGFIFECPDCLAEAVALARAEGFTPREIDYPLGSVPAAMRSARQAVPRRRRVFAYGESAGGLLAARLAQKGLVDAAAVQSPIANLPLYLAHLSQQTGDYSLGTRLEVPTLVEQRAYSPAFHRTASAVFATVAADNDPLTPPTLTWARKDSRVSAVIVPGDHLDSTGSLYPNRVRLLIGWLERREVRASRRTGD